jgi:hypothetical protein
MFSNNRTTSRGLYSNSSANSGNSSTNQTIINNLAQQISNNISNGTLDPAQINQVFANSNLVNVIVINGGTGGTGGGSRGATGPQGPDGPQGIQGPQGEKGDKGDKGDQGEQGPSGESLILTGEKGDKGDQGEKGDQGLSGEKGVQGDKGEKGDQGDQGLKGDKGEKGDQGLSGEKGDQGLKGDKGDTGTIDTRIIGHATLDPNSTPTVEAIFVGQDQDVVTLGGQLNLGTGITFPDGTTLTTANFLNDIYGPSGYYGDNATSVIHFDFGPNITITQKTKHNDIVVLDDPGFAPFQTMALFAASALAAGSTTTTTTTGNPYSVLTANLPVPTNEGYKIQLFNNSSREIQIISSANELIFNNFYCPNGATSFAFPPNRNIILVYIKNSSQEAQNTWYTFFA